MLVFDFGAVLYGINYLALRQAITPDRLLGADDRDDAASCTVAAAPFGSLDRRRACDRHRSSSDAARRGALGLALAVGAMIGSPVRTHRTHARRRGRSNGSRLKRFRHRPRVRALE